MKLKTTLLSLLALVVPSFAQMPPVEPQWPIWFGLDSQSINGNINAYGDSSGASAYASSQVRIHWGEGGNGLTKTESRSGTASWTFKATTFVQAPYGSVKVRYNIMRQAYGSTFAGYFLTPALGYSHADSASGNASGSAYSQTGFGTNNDSYSTPLIVEGTFEATISLSVDGYPFSTKSGTLTLNSQTVQAYASVENVQVPKIANWRTQPKPWEDYLSATSYGSYSIQIVSVSFQ